MYRSLVSAAAALSLLVSTFISPAITHAAKRCPDEPPSTLLSLYKKSDAIFLGKFDKTSVGDVVSEGEHSTMVNVSDHFSISSTLKGKTEKFYVRTYEQYRYKGSDESEPEIDEEGYEFGPKVGDTVLLFLKFADEEGEEKKKAKRKLDVVHYRDAIKPVDASEQSSFEARIKDLNGIFSSKKPDDAAILKWILRCIDDPVTRWDGAYELLSSFEVLEWKKQQEKEKKNEADSKGSAVNDTGITGEKVEDSRGEETETAGEDIEEEVIDNSTYAELLTDAQKGVLTNIAINSKTQEPGSENVEIRREDGDRVLFGLVKRWGDSRLAAAMLDRLRVSGDNYDRASWMSSIADVLKDDELRSLSEKFGEVTYQEDDAQIGETDGSDDVDKPAKDVEPESGEPEVPVEEDKPVEDEKSEDVTDGSAKKTYLQLRGELLAQFIDRAQVVITKETEVAKNKKAGN